MRYFRSALVALLLLGGVGFALGQAVPTNVITYNGGGNGGGGGSCSGSFCAATAPLAANLGGTSFSSYTIGDMLYASGAAALSKLPDVALTNVLLSGGVGAAPSWGKVALTALATQAADTLVLNATGGTAAPTAVAVPSCSTASSALTYNTTTHALGCNTISGGAGSPGGSNTQVQYNNASAFGGITGFTSDGVSGIFSVGNLKITGATSGTSVINASATGGGTATLFTGSDTIAGIAATQTLTNKTISGGSNTLSAIANASLTNSAMTLCGTSTSLGGSLTASACIDSIGSTRGSVLYRGAAGWAALTPGTSGDCLKSLGAGADPAYSSCAGSSVSVTSASANIVINPTPGTGTFTVGATYLINAQTGTTYTIVSGDLGKLVTFSNASSVAVTVPDATGSFAAGASFDVQNKGAGTVTLNRQTSSTINGGTSLPILTNQGCTLISDGTNWQIGACTAVGGGSGTVTSAGGSFTGGLISIAGSPITTSGTLAFTVAGTSGGIPYFSSTSAWASSALLSANSLMVGGGAGAAPATITTGTGVITGLGTALGTAGGMSTTIAAGTSAMGTSAITSATCATVVTTSATNTATTDVILASFNGDPTAVTGYVPATTGMLTIISYPTANNVNFKVCNNTSSSITPGAITLNWRVIR
jgi:hypothetical protein